jgi:predicted DCC family thiol-disulfide oxidoreductase YuxK
MISLDTEITEINGEGPARGWVLFDGSCRLCREAAQRFARLLRRHGFEPATLKAPWVQARLGLAAGADPAEMIVLTADGASFGGADGILEIARRIWWAWPLFAAAQIPGVMPLLRTAYRRLVANRHCFDGTCRTVSPTRWSDGLPLILLPLLVLFARGILPAWVFMWLLAVAIYFGCKWMTWRRAIRRNPQTGRLISIGYLLAWVGMDAGQFMRGREESRRPKASEWIWPAARILLGAVMVWFVVRGFSETRPLAAGWIGMIGIILCLHFGLFDLLALSWQGVGVDARPIMRQPLRSVSLAEFWGRRWNAAFNFLVHDLVFRPLLRRLGVAGSTFLAFLVSGVIHEIVISLPARGGYGLPTMYFAIQGLGVIFERTAIAKRLGLGRGWRGWLFAMACAAGPIFWLFHPVFVHNVILPMLQAIGATQGEI